MTLHRLIVVLTAIVLIGVPAASTAQYYGYPAPPPYVLQPAPAAPPVTGWYYPYLQRSMSNYPQMIRKWQQERWWLDMEHLQRNPLNPESTLDYMMRTF